MADSDPKQSPSPQDSNKAPDKDAPGRSGKGAKGPTPPDKSGGEGPKWKRPFIVWVLLAVFVISLFGIFSGGNEGSAPAFGGLGGGKAEPLSQRDFWQRVNDGRVIDEQSKTVTENKALPRVLLVRESNGATYLEGNWAGEEKADPFKLNFLDTRDLEATLAEMGVKVTQENRTNWFGSILVSLLPLLLLLLLFYFFFIRPMRGMGGGDSPFSFGKSRARLLSKDEAKVRFKDVAGVDEAKEEVQEIVEFLRDPKRFETLGGRVPKGILLMGPPGTGKTLLAKAIAGEAQVPFFSISGSDFVEMFVGVGASRVRDMFAQAKKNAPCILFIDERA